MIDIGRYNWLAFDLEWHKYSDKNDRDRKFISVTQLLKEYVKEVFTDEFVENYATDRGLTPEFVRAKWKIKGDYSALKGTELHLYAENYCREHIKIETVIPEIEDQKKMIVDFWDRCVANGFSFVATEFRIASKKYGVAGTIDLLVKKDDKYHILDWKSNDKIDMSGGNDLLSPLEKYADNDYHKYSIQLSIYRYLLEEEFGCEMGDSILVHIGKFQRIANVIKCFYPKEEIGAILNERFTIGV